MAKPMTVMTDAQEGHLQILKEEFCERLDKKYRAGVAEHGGNLWEKEGLLDEAIMEVIDLWVYLQTRKQQDGAVK